MRLALGLPSYRPLDPRVGMARMRLAELLAKRGIEWEGITVMQQAFLGSALTSITHYFLGSSCDRLLVLDDDVVFDPQDAIRLIDSELDCVGGDYPLKTIGGGMLCQPMPGVGPAGIYQPCVFLGLGYCAFSRKCIEAVAELSAWYQIDERYADGGQLCRATFFPRLVDGRRIEDDVSFFLRVIEAGITPMLDTTVAAGHVGTHVFTPGAARG